ncbi:CAAX prenyl protease-related protein [Janthinobacterium sp. SUN176]|uniref:CAAX prenyl protease-related protein n=1 Tax=unclassified Janthinobacterium TaxID=2610881 RepID=UPI002713FC7E|nr:MULTISPECIES: CAAX prenyl protease-related protein [unclassified Janthinobacterium]MDO8049821.1 CAAX prenyl protease-related protein [Janthinobacterium sp. SUN211]MDO8075251.1 CAAX prenyl protease-related protein [Janthinobacterium sp. SUN176]
MFDRAALPRVAPFLAYLSFIAIADMLGRLGVAAQDLRWLYVVKIGVVLGLLLYWRRSYTELRWTPLGARAILGALAGGVVVFLLWINLDASWMSIGKPDGFDPRTDGRIEWSLVVLRIAGAALVVPVMEELFWRSFLLRWIDKPDFLRADPRLASVKAFAISVLLFGFEHNLWLAGMVAGAVYSLLYMRSQSLWSPILAHGVTNGVLGLWIISGGHWIYW